MDRRSFLAAALCAGGTPAACAGCLGRPAPRAAGDDPQSAGDDPGTESGATTAYPPDSGRAVTLAGADDAPADVAVRIGAEMLRTAVTPERTARLRVTVTNDGPARRIYPGEPGCDVFNRQRGVALDGGLALNRPESTEWIEREGGRWEPDVPADQPREYASYGCLARPYDADESIAVEYLVWDDYRTEGYMRPGIYRFETGVTVESAERTATSTAARNAGSEPSRDGTDEGQTGFDWGLELAVEAR